MQHQTSAVDTNIKDGSSNVAYSDLEYVSSSAPAETSSVKNISSMPGESTNGEITNGVIETVA